MLRHLFQEVVHCLPRIPHAINIHKYRWDVMRCLSARISMFGDAWCLTVTYIAAVTWSIAVFGAWHADCQWYSMVLSTMQLIELLSKMNFLSRRFLQSLVGCWVVAAILVDGSSLQHCWATRFERTWRMHFARRLRHTDIVIIVMVSRRQPVCCWQKLILDVSGRLWGARDDLSRWLVTIQTATSSNRVQGMPFWTKASRLEALVRLC